MRVGLDKTVAREVLAAVAHASLQQAVHQTFGEQRDNARVAAECAVANHARFTIVQVQHRGKAEVNAAAAQLGRHHVTAGGGSIGGPELVFHPQRAQGAHGRQVGEAVGGTALHTAAFMVNADQQITAQAFDRGAQGTQLGPVLPIAAKQDQAAHQRIFQALTVSLGQLGSSDIDDERSVLGHERLSYYYFDSYKGNKYKD